ncbi:MAG: hypothetical protein JW917_09870 [Ignavibacteria bacterium]|nr:hypothetical protein [Ignavibacteria bacterium]
MSKGAEKYGFNEKSFNDFENLFNVKPANSGNSFSFNVTNKQKKTEISIEIITESEDNALISVYTENAHLQLQNANYFLISEMLSEVIFISETGDKISGLIISSQGDCSLYSNVSKNILKGDFANLSSEKLIAAVALSLAESN